MTTQEIQNAQQSGSIYANDNYHFIYKEGMSQDDFAEAALENYNANAEAFNESPLPQECEVDFLFGAKNAFRE